MTKIEIPSFTSEADEAKWWFDHSEELDDEFLAAATEGRASHGALAKQFGLTLNFIRLDARDAHLARELASKRGVDYEQYVQSLIHEALLRNEQAPEPEGTIEAAAA